MIKIGVNKIIDEYMEAAVLTVFAFALEQVGVGRARRGGGGENGGVGEAEDAGDGVAHGGAGHGAGAGRGLRDDGTAGLPQHAAQRALHARVLALLVRDLSSICRPVPHYSVNTTKSIIKSSA